MMLLRIIPLLLLLPALATAEGVVGYYRFPALRGDTIVFAAEGDLWTVSVDGGLAHRLTTHPGEETRPAISPDGATLAFSATYEGPMEVYTMPLTGGLPQRRTWARDGSMVTGWHPDGRLVYMTNHYATKPDLQLVALDLEQDTYERIPLAEASEGVYDEAGEALFFVRPSFHGNVTKRYRGGTARKIWRFDDGADEAVPLTPDYDGESHSPMWWRDRLYYITDRDGTMNIWSMDADAAGRKQHTRHSGWDVRDASLDDGRLVYQVGADLWLHDLASRASRRVPITLASDVDQWRDKWVKDPMSYLTRFALHPEGESVALTARGRVFVAPTKQGRLARVTWAPGVRYRDAVYMPDGETLLALSDTTGEFEFVQVPVAGVGEERPLTDDGAILRFRGHPSPDGEWIAYTDQNRDLWLLHVESGEQKVISTNRQWSGHIAWAPDSGWLAFVQDALNSYDQIALYSVHDESLTMLTSDRVNSLSPAWDPAGDWLYFLSDRQLRSLVTHPWGPRQPEPYFDKPVEIYQIALRPGLRSPFRHPDELYDGGEDEDGEEDEKKEDDGEDDEDVDPVVIELQGIEHRVRKVPVPAGNYDGLRVSDEALFWLARGSGPDAKVDLMALEIDNDDPEAEALVEEVSGYDLSLDGEHLLVRRKDDLYVFDAGTSAPQELSDSKVDLSGWTFRIDVREDWRQMFIDAWRMERDYFYDPGMHGVDWDGVRDKYLPLVDRVTTRDELSELIGRAVGELSALHTSVRGGDHRRGPDDVGVAELGARLSRDPRAGGYRIQRVYRSDPDYPDERSPLADPDLGIAEGDVILAVNGIEALSVPHIGALLRNQAGRQVRLRVQAAGGDTRDEIVEPIANGFWLRYGDWRYARRVETESKGKGAIGYVHLTAMGGRSLSEWYRQFYPVFNRPGLIIDVRHNWGGNIDSIILEKLLRRAWFYWKRRVGQSTWNMQYAFRGHMVVLCDARTASDGEAFAEGFRRLGLGPVIGKRTWGGEIWLNSSNRLSDRGIARAPMSGVYGPEGEWLIEQRGVEPDIEVDKPPHATFKGEDAQLQAAIDYLLARIEEDPRDVPSAPPYPVLRFDYPEGEDDSGSGRP